MADKPPAKPFSQEFREFSQGIVISEGWRRLSVTFGLLGVAAWIGLRAELDLQYAGPKPHPSVIVQTAPLPPNPKPKSLEEAIRLYQQANPDATRDEIVSRLSERLWSGDPKVTNIPDITAKLRDEGVRRGVNRLLSAISYALFFFGVGLACFFLPWGFIQIVGWVVEGFTREGNSN